MTTEKESKASIVSDYKKSNTLLFIMSTLHRDKAIHMLYLLMFQYMLNRERNEKQIIQSALREISRTLIGHK